MAMKISQRLAPQIMRIRTSGGAKSNGAGNYGEPPSKAEREQLQLRLAQIDRELVTLDARLDALPPESVYVRSYQRQELESERATLAASRRSVEARLRVQRKPIDAKKLAIIESEFNSQSETIRHHVSMLEKNGLFREARIWRQQLLELRQQLVSQYAD